MIQHIKAHSKFLSGNLSFMLFVVLLSNLYQIQVNTEIKQCCSKIGPKIN